MLRILILHSAGISSSSSLSSLNALATEAFGGGTIGFEIGAFVSFNWIPGFGAVFKFIEILEMTGAGGTFADLLSLSIGSSLLDEVLLDLDLILRR